MRNDGDVGDAGLLDGIHDGGKGAEGHILIGAEIDDLVSGVGAHLMELVTEIVNVDGGVAEEDLLALIDGDDEALLGDFLHGAGLGDGDFNAGLQHGRGNHEDHEQHEDYIDERSDVDIRERGAGVAGAGGEGHG